MVLLGLLMDGGHWGLRPSQKLASLQPLSSLHLSPLRRVQPDVQQGPWKHGENERRRIHAVHSQCTHTQENTRERNACPVVWNVCTYPRSFIFPFFLFSRSSRNTTEPCVRARWMRIALKREGVLIVGTLSTFISAFNVYIVHDIRIFGNLLRNVTVKLRLDRFGNNFGFGKWIFWKKKKGILIGLRLFFTLRSVVIDLVQRSFFDFPLVNFSRNTPLLDVAMWFCCLKNKFVEMKIVKIEIRKRRSLPAIFY